MTGIEFRDSTLVIKPGNLRKLQAGMVVNLSLGIEEVEPKEDSKVRWLQGAAGLLCVLLFFLKTRHPLTSPQKAKPYTLLIADTLVVREDEAPEVLTEEAKRDWKSIHFNFDETEEAEPADVEEVLKEVSVWC